MIRLAWMDVISDDITATLAHYAGLFGWTSRQLDLEPGATYHLVSSRGEIVAGAEQVARERGLDPAWTLMVETEDAPALLRAAVAAGAVVTCALAPMLALGRIAMLRDPLGATIGVWEPGTFCPSRTPDVPGRLCGAVLRTPDPDGSVAFYRGLFDWTPASGPHHLEGGVPVFVETAELAGWIPALAVSDSPALPAVHLGSRLTEAGPVRCTDPTGASFCLLAPNSDESPRSIDDLRGIT